MFISNVTCAGLKTMQLKTVFQVALGTILGEKSEIIFQS